MKLATLCYVQREGKTLMIHRNKNQGDMHLGKWNGLGGKLEEGESPQECAVREVGEESGLEAKNPILAGFLTFPMFDGQDDWYCFVFRIEDFSGELKHESAEGKLEWFPNEDVFKLPLWEGDHIFLPWIFEKRFFMAKFVYAEKKLVDYSASFYP